MPWPRDFVGMIGVAPAIGFALLGGAAWAQSIGEAGISLPIHDIELDCHDSRFPTLAGPWILWCTHDVVDRARSLTTGEDFRLPLSHRSPGVGPSRVYVPGRDGGVIHLGIDGPTLDQDITRIHHDLVSPGTIVGDWVAILTASSLQAFPIHQRSRRSFSATPAEWYPPALSPPYVAWVEDGGTDGEDVYWLHTEEEHAGRVLAGGTGNQRHVVASTGHFAWVEPDALVILDIEEDTRRQFPANTGFNAPPTLWQDIACWEERGESEIDIRCSDGLQLERPEHQLHPSIHDEWLIFRENGRLFVHRRDSPDRPPPEEP